MRDKLNIAVVHPYPRPFALRLSLLKLISDCDDTEPMKLFIVILVTLYCNLLLGFDDISRIYLLAENTRDVIYKASPIPKNFNLNQKETDLVVNYALLDKEIAEYALGDEVGPSVPCSTLRKGSSSSERLASMVKNRKYGIFFTMQVQGNDVNKNNAYFGSTRYADIKATTLGNGNLANNAAENAKNFQEYLNGHSEGNIPKSSIALHYAHSVITKDPSTFKETLKQVKDSMTLEDKILLVSELGSIFKKNYNHDGIGDGDDSRKESFKDMVLVQGEILRALGVPKESIYVISYKTTDASHATLAVQDPDNPNRIIKLNYGLINEVTNTSGPGALSQEAIKPGCRHKKKNF